MKKKKRRSKFIYSKKTFLEKSVESVYYLVKDSFKNLTRKEKPFPHHSITVFEGAQGTGKTISMTSYIKEIKARYPKCLVYANYDVDVADEYIDSIEDLITKRNGTDGIIFAVDEIGHLFDNQMKAKELPEGFLAEITMQRKQRVHIVGTSQSFLMMNKSLRRQTREVVRCFNLFGRTFFNVCYSAPEYEYYNEAAISGEKRRRIKRRWRRWFVADDKLFGSFDTYQKVARLWSRTDAKKERN